MRPDAIRSKLYSLFFHGEKIKWQTLAILKPAIPHTTQISAIKTVIKSLLEKNIAVVILGGSQELTFANYTAYEVLETTVNLAVIDGSIDMGEFREEISPSNYLSKIVLHDPSYLIQPEHSRISDLLVRSGKHCPSRKIIFRCPSTGVPYFRFKNCGTAVAKCGCYKF